MSWDYYHLESERFSSAAESALKSGDNKRAAELYKLAADAETYALKKIEPTKTRTIGITAVSASALYYKAGEYLAAKDIAQEWLNNNNLPSFASEQLREILQTIDSKALNLLPEKGEQDGSTISTKALSHLDGHTSIPNDEGHVNILKRFLWFCAGADVAVLSRPETATDQVKYASIGVEILLTSILSALSAGYALFIVFSSTLSSYILGALWAATIFFLSRFIFNIKKDEKNLGRLLIIILPRLVLGVLLSILIVIPLQMKLFQREIESELGRENAIRLSNIRAETTQSFNEIDELENQNQQLLNDLRAKEAKRDQLYEELIAEGDASVKITGRYGRGTIYRERNEQLAQTTRELEEQRFRTNQLVQNNQERIKKLKELRDAEVAQFSRQSEMVGGLLARLEAFARLRAMSPTLTLSSWLIILFFIIINLSPLLIKLLSAPGPYDVILRRMESEVMLREEREILNLEIQGYIDAEVNKELKRILLQSKLRSEEDLDLASVQADLVPKISGEIQRRLKERVNALSALFPPEKGSIPTNISS